MREKRKISPGTWIMLTATVIILAASAIVLLRLYDGGKADATRLQAAAGSVTASPAPAATQQAAAAPAATARPADAQHTQTADQVHTVTMTFAGSVCLDSEVRKNCYYSDVKQYDYYDVMTLLRGETQSDLNVVFLENILIEDGTATDVKAAAAAASMLKAGGFNVAACGFSKAYDLSEEGIRTTRKLLRDHGIEPRGIREYDGQDTVRVTEMNGIRIALLQYTGTVAAATRKSMVKQGTEGTVPEAEAERIAAEIGTARAQGCDAVIVLLNWGKTGKAPDKAQKTLAQKIADAGADLIVGCGSRTVSGADALTAEDGRQVLCVWSLGSLLTGDRSNINRIAGMMLHATVRKEAGRTGIIGFSYTPVYTWRWKMDGRFHYRCLPAGGSIPDGMDSEQQKAMKKAADTVRNAMKNAPLEESMYE